MSESDFLRQVLDLAAVYGWRRLHIRPGRTADGWRTTIQGDGIGFPDLLLLKPPRLLVAELKVGRRQPTPDQLAWLGAFERAGVPAYSWWPDDWDEIRRVLAG